MFGLTIGEIGALFTVFGALVVGWINVRISIARIEADLDNVKEQIHQEKQDNQHSFDKIDKKLDLLHQKIDRLK